MWFAGVLDPIAVEPDPKFNLGGEETRMRVETAGRTRAFLFAAAIAVAAATNAFAQGSVTGRVTTKDGSQPLSDARVTVIGSSISAHSNADGRFRLAAVPAGAVTIRVNRLGYVETKQVVTVTNGADRSEERRVGKECRDRGARCR